MSKIRTAVAVALITAAGGVLGAWITASASACPAQLEDAKERVGTLEKQAAAAGSERDLCIENLGEVTRLCGGARSAGSTK